MKGALIVMILLMAGCFIAGCDEKEKPSIIIINRPVLNVTANEVHIEPGESWDFEFWWDTEGKQEWPESSDYEFILNNSRKVEKVEGCGQIDNISTDKRTPSFTYTAFDNVVGFEKVQYFIILFYNDKYYNSSGSISIFVEKEFNDIPISVHDRYYRTIEDITGTAHDDASTFTARGYFSWPKIKGAHIYEMTVHFNGNDPGDLFWNKNPQPYLYDDGDTNKKNANSNQMQQGELKGWYVGLEDHKDDFMIIMGGPSIDFEDGEWEQSEIDTKTAENKTKTENYFQGWTADVLVVPDDRWF